MDVKTLGHYDIIGPLGAGGMGEVYRARDRRLDREVAIKVLPQAVAEDPDRLARFEREARLLAALNHINVGAIYGLEHDGSRRFLALELIEGETLAQLLEAGPLNLETATVICSQIARALEAAHERGIIHRDLKPANVKITPSGAVKVLDFGLAKAYEVPAAGPGVSPVDSPTITAGHTGTGVIMGTAAYMSPEQARGAALDARTDVWSFGCVLYDVLVGRPAFARDTVSDTLVAILEHEPDLTRLPADVPARIRTLLRRCLSKDPDRRLHHIADARIELEDTAADEETAAVGSGASARRGVLWVVGIAIAAMILGFAGRGVLIDPGAGRAGSLDEVIRLTHDPGLSEWPTWSPDGREIAFASSRDGDFDIYVRRVEGGQEVNVTDDPGDDFQPAFSPDGEWIAFVSTRSSESGLVKIGATFGMEFRTYGGDVWLVPALGGRARRLAEQGNSPAWHPGAGSVIYVSGPENHRSINSVTLEGDSTPLLAVQDSDWEIVRTRYSPDASWLTFDTVNPDRVMIMPAAGGEVRELLSGVSHVWGPKGDRLYYLSRDPSGGTRLLSVELDSASGTSSGEPRTVGLVTGTLRDLALANDGHSFAAAELEGSMNLTLLPLNAAGDAPDGPEVRVSPGQVIDRYPRFSPDGRMIAVASDRLGSEEIWLFDRATGEFDRLELPGDDEGVNLAYWSPDSSGLTMTRFYPDGNRSIWYVAIDGSGAEELLSPRPRLQGSPLDSTGQRLLYSALHEDVLQLFALDTITDETTQITTSAGDKSSGEWSPDGGTIVFQSNVTGAVQLWTIDLETGEETRISSGNDRIRHAFFSPDGRWIYFQPNHLNVYRVPVSGGEPVAVTHFPESGLFLEEPTLSPDGRYLAYCRSNGGSSLWVLRTGE